MQPATVTKTVGNVFVPLSWQVAPWQDKSFIMLLTGAAGGGKSRLAAEKLHAYNLKYPGVTTIVGRKDKTAAMKSVVPFLQYTVMGDTDWGEYRKSDGLFEYNNGSHLWVVGVRDEGQREQLRSIGKDGNVDMAWFEEANKLTEDDSQEVQARMRGTKGGFRQQMYTTNPDHPYHWIKLKLIDKKQASVWYSRPENNPYNPDDYIEGLKNLTGVFRDRMWSGKWVQAEGIIFSEYDASKHLIDKRIATPHDGRYIVSVDFGFTHPFSCSLWRIDNADRLWQVKQIYRTKTLVEDHAADIRDMIIGCGIPLPRIEAWVCDHDAEGRATLEKHLNIITKPAYKSVKEGIEAVNSRFKHNRLFLNNQAVDNVDAELEGKYLPTSTSEEITGYSWSDKKQDEPIKENDHGCDEMRYCVAHVDKIGSQLLAGSAKSAGSNRIQ